MQQQRFLVIMTNNDAYYISRGDAEQLRLAMETNTSKTAGVVDVKSGAKLVLQLHSISALVEEGNRG